MFHEDLADLCYQTLSCVEDNTICFGVNYPVMADIRFQACLTEFYQKAYNLLDMFAGLKITIGAGAAYSEVSSFSVPIRMPQTHCITAFWPDAAKSCFGKRLRLFPTCHGKEKEAYLHQFRKAVEFRSFCGFHGHLEPAVFKPKHLFRCLMSYP